MAGYDNREELRKMLERYLAGEATPEEIRLLESWDIQLDGRLNAFDRLGTEKEHIRQEMESRLATFLKDRRAPKNSFKKPFMYAAAAVLLITTTFLAYFYKPWFTSGQGTSPVTQVAILPGGNKATLTMADGRTILLSQQQEGIIVAADAVTYTDGSKVLNPVKKRQKPEAAGYNVITTPSGGQYQVLLPDGTKVWLNAASSLSYPSHFLADKREVKLTGEGYFEVNNRPSAVGNPVAFVVKTKGQTVSVLGTSLNINAYEDSKNVVTTLLTGRVRVNTNGEKATELKPGEETLLAASGDLKKRQADLIAATAWRNGIFYFNDTPLNEMLPQIARWYDIDFSYESGIPRELFTGKMSRKVQLSVLLNFLKNSGIDYRLEGRKLILK